MVVLWISDKEVLFRIAYHSVKAGFTADLSSVWIVIYFSAAFEEI